MRAGSRGLSTCDTPGTDVTGRHDPGGVAEPVRQGRRSGNPPGVRAFFPLNRGAPLRSDPRLPSPAPPGQTREGRRAPRICGGNGVSFAARHRSLLELGMTFLGVLWRSWTLGRHECVAGRTSVVASHWRRQGTIVDEALLRGSDWPKLGVGMTATEQVIEKVRHLTEDQAQQLLEWLEQGARDAIPEAAPPGAVAMLGFARRFSSEPRTTAQWLTELREGEA